MRNVIRTVLIITRHHANTVDWVTCIALIVLLLATMPGWAVWVAVALVVLLRVLSIWHGEDRAVAAILQTTASTQKALIRRYYRREN